MKKRIYILITISLILIGLIYFNLPFELTRKADIDFGNKMISQIEKYRLENKQLPKTDDWKILEQLGFKVELLGTDPSYLKINEDEYELIYLEGFDGPYLLYNSVLKKWKIDQPKFPQKDNEEMEQGFPWTKDVTKVAIDAIIFSIENLKKPESMRDNNFPSDLNNMPFNLTEKEEFQIIGYSTSTNSPEVYQIDFQPKNEYKSGPRITVEINIKTKKAIRVYMTPDA